jgi:hypothetical protein
VCAEQAEHLAYQKGFEDASGDYDPPSLDPLDPLTIAYNSGFAEGRR